MSERNSINMKHKIVVCCLLDFFYKWQGNVTDIPLYEPRHDKTNKMAMRPAKTQISLGIRLRCPHEESLDP